MLQDLLVITNLPYFVVALVSFHLGYHVWCILMLCVFVSSTVYHAHNHNAVMGMCDRCFAVLACMSIASVAIFKSSKSALSAGMVMFILSLFAFLDFHEDEYDNDYMCVTHSLWHILSATTALLLVVAA